MSAAGGILNVHLATVNGTPRVAAFVPLPAGTGPRGDMLGMRTELRIRADLMPGYKGVPLLWPNADNNFPFWGEIDWPESDFANQPRAYMHRQGATTVNDQDTYTSLTGTTWQQWHTYVLEWVPGVSAAFYEDGTLIGRSTSRVPAGPMHWVLQFETSLSTVPAAATQGNVQIDYLQVSAQGGPSSTPSPSPTASSTASPSPTASSSPTSTATPTPSPTPSSGTTIVAVGDIHGEGSDADSVATNNLVNSINPTAVLGLGDYQYSTGTCANFMTSGRYNSDWGVQTRRMYATMGPTHDYDGASAEAHRYFSGQCANQSTVSPGAVAAGGIQDWGEPYSFDLGGWHIVQLPSTCERYSGSTCSVASINTWLAADLAAHPSACTLAYTHEPYWTSPTATHTRSSVLKPWMTTLYNAGAEIVLSGHQHMYERFRAQNPDDVATVNGLVEFIVGTGGIGFYPRTSTATNSVAYQASNYGVLRLTLRAGAADFTYMPTAGTFSDSGTVACH